MKIFYLFLAFLLIAGITSCGKIEEPQFRRIENFKVNKISLDGTNVSLSITFYNPNRFGVSIKEATFDIYVDSLYAGNFRQDEAVQADKGTEFSIPIIGDIPLKTALKMDISKLVNRDIFFQANGTVKIGKGGIFITKPFNYSGKHQIKM